MKLDQFWLKVAGVGLAAGRWSDAWHRAWLASLAGKYQYPSANRVKP